MTGVYFYVFISKWLMLDPTDPYEPQTFALNSSLNLWKFAHHTVKGYVHSYLTIFDWGHPRSSKVIYKENISFLHSFIIRGCLWFLWFEYNVFSWKSEEIVKRYHFFLLIILKPRHKFKIMYSVFGRLMNKKHHFYQNCNCGVCFLELDWRVIFKMFQ